MKRYAIVCKTCLTEADWKVERSVSDGVEATITRYWCPQCDEEIGHSIMLDMGKLDIGVIRDSVLTDRADWVDGGSS